MTFSPDRVEEVASALAANGLMLRGGFSFGDDEVAPDGPSGAPAK
jgi:hypothetical protein